MKESEFIEQNKEKWLNFENNLSKKDISPAKTSKLFVQITDDLSYARTFYQNRSVKIYLNGSAKLLFNDINKTNKKGFAAFIHFWKSDLPLTMYLARRAMLISFIVFVCCFILGVVTSIHDPNFARTILSNDYVNMTNENIAKGDAMAVYKSRSEVNTFLPIFYNNLKVDFMTFFSGIFMAIGSLVVMIVNGVMVGVFQYFFIERHLFWESFLTIWTHGALEISAIILSGGAGLTLGKGFLFPGTYSRFQSFKISGMNGLKIIMGVAPVTLLAAFIEGFLTRHTGIPNPLRFSFILLSFAFILTYFFWYPRKVAKKTLNIHEVFEPELVYKAKIEFNTTEILETTKIITETLRLLFTNFSFLGGLVCSLSLVLSILIATDPLNIFHVFENYNFSIIKFFDYSEFPMLAVISLICFIAIITFSFITFKRFLIKEERKNIYFRSASFSNSLYAVMLSTPLFISLLMIDNSFIKALAFVLLPILIFMSAVATHENIFFLSAISLSGSLLYNKWLALFGISLVFFSIGCLVYITGVYGLKLLFVQDALVWMLTDDDLVAEKISMGLSVFQTAFSFLIYLVLSVISSSLLFYTLKESYTAEDLISRIGQIKAGK